MDAAEFTKKICAIAADKKATRVVDLDLREKSDICQFMVVCSGSNDRQTKAIGQAIEETCRTQFGIKPLAMEGMQNGHWVLLDYGYTVVHVFLDMIRDYYAIESLWGPAAATPGAAAAPKANPTPPPPKTPPASPS